MSDNDYWGSTLVDSFTEQANVGTAVSDQPDSFLKIIAFISFIFIVILGYLFFLLRLFLNFAVRLINPPLSLVGIRPFEELGIRWVQNFLVLCYQNTAENSFHFWAVVAWLLIPFIVEIYTNWARILNYCQNGWNNLNLEYLRAHISQLWTNFVASGTSFPARFRRSFTDSLRYIGNSLRDGAGYIPLYFWTNLLGIITFSVFLNVTAEFKDVIPSSGYITFSQFLQVLWFSIATPGRLWWSFLVVAGLFWYSHGFVAAISSIIAFFILSLFNISSGIFSKVSEDSNFSGGLGHAFTYPMYGVVAIISVAAVTAKIVLDNASSSSSVPDILTTQEYGHKFSDAATPPSSPSRPRTSIAKSVQVGERVQQARLNERDAAQREMQQAIDNLAHATPANQQALEVLRQAAETKLNTTTARERAVSDKPIETRAKLQVKDQHQQRQKARNSSYAKGFGAIVVVATVIYLVASQWSGLPQTQDDYEVRESKYEPQIGPSNIGDLSPPHTESSITVTKSKILLSNEPIWTGNQNFPTPDPSKVSKEPKKSGKSSPITENSHAAPWNDIEIPSASGLLSFDDMSASSDSSNTEFEETKPTTRRKEQQSTTKTTRKTTSKTIPNTAPKSTSKTISKTTQKTIPKSTPKSTSDTTSRALPTSDTSSVATISSIYISTPRPSSDLEPLSTTTVTQSQRISMPNRPRPVFGGNIPTKPPICNPTFGDNFLLRSLCPYFWSLWSCVETLASWVVWLLMLTPRCLMLVKDSVLFILSCKISDSDGSCYNPAVRYLLVTAASGIIYAITYFVLTIFYRKPPLSIKVSLICLWALGLGILSKANTYWPSDGYYAFVLLSFLLKVIRIIPSIVSRFTYSPRSPPAPPTVLPSNVHVFVLVTGALSDTTQFTNLIEDIINCGVGKVEIGTENMQEFVALGPLMTGPYHACDVWQAGPAFGASPPTKREMINIAITERAQNGADILCFVDQNTMWGDHPVNFLRSALAQFEDANVGIVGSTRNVEEADIPTLFTVNGIINRFKDYITRSETNRVDFDNTASYNIDGSVSLIPSSTWFAKRTILQRPDFLDHLINGYGIEQATGYSLEEYYVTQYFVANRHRLGWVDSPDMDDRPSIPNPNIDNFFSNLLANAKRRWLQRVSIISEEITPRNENTSILLRYPWFFFYFFSGMLDNGILLEILALLCNIGAHSIPSGKALNWCAFAALHVTFKLAERLVMRSSLNEWLVGIVLSPITILVWPIAEGGIEILAMLNALWQ